MGELGDIPIMGTKLIQDKLTILFLNDNNNVFKIRNFFFIYPNIFNFLLS